MIQEIFSPRPDGWVDVRLSAAEADAVRRVAADLAEALEVAADDPGFGRLFPPAYAHDEARQAEFRRMTRDELHRGRVDAARVVISSLEGGSPVRRGRWAGALDPETAGCWLRVLNDARLLLGTRLDVSEDMDPNLPRNDPRRPTMDLYLYLSALEEALVDALATQLPPAED